MGQPVVHFKRVGGTRLFGPEQVTPDVQLGLFNDPEGHMIGLLKGAS